MGRTPTRALMGPYSQVGFTLCLEVSLADE